MVVEEWVVEDLEASEEVGVDLGVLEVVEEVQVVVEVRPEEWVVEAEVVLVSEVEEEALVAQARREVLDNLEDNKVVKVDQEEKDLGSIILDSHKMDLTKGMLKFIIVFK